MREICISSLLHDVLYCDMLTRLMNSLKESDVELHQKKITSPLVFKVCQKRKVISVNAKRKFSDIFHTIGQSRTSIRESTCL